MKDGIPEAAELRSGRPHSPKRPVPAPEAPRLTENLRCDAVVIGAGITGALIGYHLARENLSVAILDKREPGSGSTAASTSLLQYAFDTELAKLAERRGEAIAARCYRVSYDAVQKIGMLEAEIGGGFEFHRRESLYLASTDEHVPRLLKEYELRLKHGFDVEYLDEAEMRARFPFRAPAAILTRGDGELDGLSLTRRLIAAATDRGLRAFDETEVVEIDTPRNGVVLTTDSGARVTAKEVVFATGYLSQRYLKRRVGSLSTTFAIVTKPLSPFPFWPGRCLVSETARPYSYLRTTADDRIIIGGEDVPNPGAHEDPRIVEEKSARLFERLRRIFPESPLERESSWAGTFGNSPDGLPFIGRSPEWRNAFFALAYGGNGITTGLIAAEIIRDALLGRHNPDAVLFRLDR